MVSGILRALGIPVYDTDSRTKALYEGELGMRLEEDLGQKLHTADGHFDRKALAALISQTGKSWTKSKKLSTLRS